jgi:Protein of unknown function (DUF2786)
VPDLDSILEKIQALLAKAESSEFPEEQKAFWAKANAMMLQYAIDEAQLRASGNVIEEPILEEWSYGGKSDAMLRYQRASRMLAHTVAKNNRCRTIFHRATGVATICGFKSDINFTKLLYGSLWTQALLQSCLLPSQRQLFVNSFFDGFADEIDSRLKAADDEVVQASPGNALALRDIDRVVSDAYNKAFPIRGKLSTTSMDSGTYSAGREAGRNADISGGRNAISNQRGLPQ